MYFSNFPRIRYLFPDSVERIYQALHLRVDIAKALTFESGNLEKYEIQDKDTPEIMAYDRYGDPSLNWVIMIPNRIMNIYTDWPCPQETLQSILRDKYRNVIDSDGIERELTDLQVDELLEFTGAPDNDYTGSIDLDQYGTVPRVIIRPHHFEDIDGNYYDFSTIGASVDAFGRSINIPTLYPVSMFAYEFEKNESKRQIYVPSKSIAMKMKKELGELINA